MNKILIILSSIGLSLFSLSSTATSSTGRHVIYQCSQKYIEDSSSLGYFARGRLQEGKSIQLTAGKVRATFQATTNSNGATVTANQTEGESDNWTLELSPDFPTGSIVFHYSVWWDVLYTQCDFTLKKDE